MIIDVLYYWLNDSKVDVSINPNNIILVLHWGYEGSERRRQLMHNNILYFWGALLATFIPA